MTNSVRFLELLTRLRATGASFARIKVLSEMWRFVSELSADERVELIRGLGLEGQERVFERFLSSPGTRSAEILQLADDVLQRVEVEKLESPSPQRLSEDSLDRTSDESIHEIGSPTAATPPRPPDLQPSAPLPSDRFSDTDISGHGAAKEEDITLSQSVKQSTDPDESVDQEVPQPAVTQAVATPRLEPDENAVTPPLMEPMALESASAGSGPSDHPETEPPDEEKTVAIMTTTEEGQTINELIQQLGEIDSPSTRFRTMMKHGSQLNTVTCQDAAQLLGLFPPGWMQRRVLMMLLRNGISSEFDELLELIEESVTRPSDYLWYTGVMIEAQSMSESETALLLEKSPTRTIKRKISNWQR
jgi:hypothetical protein